MECYRAPTHDTVVAIMSCDAYSPTTLHTEQTKERRSTLTWDRCRWIYNHYNLRLGGIDAAYSGEEKGTNGSIAPQKTLDVLQALHAAATTAADTDDVVHVPMFIDAGASEGRALLHWAFMVTQQKDFEPKPIEVYGFELPHLRGYQEIHQSAETRAAEELSCPVHFRIVWKDCKNIRSLSEEFYGLSDRLCVLYTFWTCWYVEDKLKLLKLVAAEPTIMAMAVYLTSRDKPYKGQPFDTEFILHQLCKHSTESKWSLYTSIPGCRFICGNETATAVVFRRIESMRDKEQSNESSDNQQSQDLLEAFVRPVHFDGFQVLGLGPDTKDGWSDMCNDCGGGGK